ncbi:AraC family transcriptional regulator [Paenibacillus sp. CAA11]|uniref:AraC family transcriptional regulator n=1 Tax=Paenibacillus sp. CAA11 TaxID=1532905 RepID=UPI000D38E6E5|nr:AraC family transcriptional regulator [Paenibacillus sp. CAA11]AWB46612.1 AraC family transcriptional regulator [Paenibacillus sp. CAA11]
MSFGFKSTHKVWEICQLLSESFDIPYAFFDKNKDLIFKWPIGSNLPYFESAITKTHPEYLTMEVTWPVIVTLNHFETFIFLRLIEDTRDFGTLVIGPTLPFRLREDQLTGFLNDLGGQLNKVTYFSYYNSLTVIGQEQLKSIGMMVYYMIYGKLITKDKVETRKITEEFEAQVENPDVVVARNRERNTLHHDPAYDAKLFQTIERGNKEELLSLINRLPEGQLGTLSKSSFLRSKKNLAISAIAIGTRVAIRGGLYSEIAFTLSDLYIQKVEDVTHPEGVDQLLEEALCTFADRVKQSIEHLYSKPISKCHNFIFTHLYEPISLDDLVHHVHLHPSYLSTLFKKEVGMTVSEYIQEAKIKEAKHLLDWTDYSLTKISTLLNFTDQSHFTKVFKKITGITPKKYRLTGNERSISN